MRFKFILILSTIVVSCFAITDFEMQQSFEQAFGTSIDNGELSLVEKHEMVNPTKEKSINYFMKSIFKNTNELILIIYPNNDYKDAAEILYNAISSKRQSNKNSYNSDTRVKMVKVNEIKDYEFFNYRSLVMGNYSNNRFFNKMKKNGRIEYGSKKSIFKLYPKPNSLFIACKQKRDIVDVTRTLMASYKIFDGAVYTYTNL